MFEIRELKQLIAIADSGTISRAAEQLYLSQPALSRAMQRLEERLGVELFTRTGNRTELNENGKFFVRIARDILSSCEEGVRRLHEFDRARNTFSIGSCAPAPLWKLGRELSASLPGRQLSADTRPVEELVRGLDTGVFRMIIINRPLEKEGVICREYCRERLYISLPAEHRLAVRRSVTLSDIDGITMLLYEGIGVWHDIVARLSHTRFIVQRGFEDFADLVTQSSLPSFTTDLAAVPGGGKNGRVVIPVEDAGAEQIFYICTLQEYKNLLPRIAGEGEVTNA